MRLHRWAGGYSHIVVGVFFDGIVTHLAGLRVQVRLGGVEPHDVCLLYTSWLVPKVYEAAPDSAPR